MPTQAYTLLVFYTEIGIKWSFEGKRTASESLSGNICHTDKQENSLENFVLCSPTMKSGIVVPLKIL